MGKRRPALLVLLALGACTRSPVPSAPDEIGQTPSGPGVFGVVVEGGTNIVPSAQFPTIRSAVEDLRGRGWGRVVVGGGAEGRVFFEEPMLIEDVALEIVIDPEQVGSVTVRNLDPNRPLFSFGSGSSESLVSGLIIEDVSPQGATLLDVESRDVRLENLTLRGHTGSTLVEVAPLASVDVRESSFQGFENAVRVHDLASARICRNEIFSGSTAVVVEGGTNVWLASNLLADNQLGLVLRSGRVTSLSNTFGRHTGVAVVVEGGTSHLDSTNDAFIGNAEALVCSGGDSIDLAYGMSDSLSPQCAGVGEGFTVGDPMVDSWFRPVSSRSPLVDQGDDLVGVDFLTDMRGIERPLDGDGDGIGRLDVGVFEYDPNSCGGYEYELPEAESGEWTEDRPGSTYGSESCEADANHGAVWRARVTAMLDSVVTLQFAPGANVPPHTEDISWWVVDKTAEAMGCAGLDQHTTMASGVWPARSGNLTVELDLWPTDGPAGDLWYMAPTRRLMLVTSAPGGSGEMELFQYSSIRVDRVCVH